MGYLAKVLTSQVITARGDASATPVVVVICTVRSRIAEWSRYPRYHFGSQRVYSLCQVQCGSCYSAVTLFKITLTYGETNQLLEFSKKKYFPKFWCLECENFTICLQVCSLYMIRYYLPGLVRITDFIFHRNIGGGSKLQAESKFRPLECNSSECVKVHSEFWN